VRQTEETMERESHQSPLALSLEEKALAYREEEEEEEEEPTD